LAVRTNGERRATFSPFPRDLVQAVCALHDTRHLLCHNVFYDHTLAEIWMLPDVYILQINSGKKNGGMYICHSA